MRDLRDMLDQAAGSPPDLPDITMIRRRARPQQLRRRTALAAAVLAAGAAGSAGVIEIVQAVDDHPTGVVQPAPPPAPPTAQSLRLGQLEPGTYQGRVGDYSFLLQTSNDDWLVFVDEPSWVAFTYRQYVLHLQEWASVVPPSSHDGRGEQAAPADIAQWLRANPRLSTGPATPTTVGGVQATRLDARVVRPLDESPSECAGQPCVILGRIAGSDEPVDIEVGQRVRFLIVESSGRQLVLYYRAPEREFAVVDEAAGKLLAGLGLTAPR